MKDRKLGSKIVVVLFWAAAAFLSVELFMVGRQIYFDIRDTLVSAEPLRLATIEIDNLERLRVEGTELMRLTLAGRENGAIHQQKIPELREEFEASWDRCNRLIGGMPMDGKYRSSPIFNQSFTEQFRAYLNFRNTLDTVENLDLALDGFSNVEYLQNLDYQSSVFAVALADIRLLVSDTNHPLLN